MEPALCEISLVLSAGMAPSARITRLASTLKALDSLGAVRVLRTVSDAPDRVLKNGRGLRSWCFDSSTQKDAGRFVAGRLSRAPYLDGQGGLFANAEGECAIEASIQSVPSIAGGFVALSDGMLVLLHCPANPPIPVVHLEKMTPDDAEESEDVDIIAVDSAAGVLAHRAEIEFKIEGAVCDGATLLKRIPEICPKLVLGTGAMKQLGGLTGFETFFPQVVRHLRALSRAAEEWKSGSPFKPAGVTYSVESGVTLNHGTFGPQRDFPTPAGFSTDRWSLHTKLTGVPGARLYYKTAEFLVDSEPGGTEIRVAVGYLGPHLDTVRFH